MSSRTTEPALAGLGGFVLGVAGFLLLDRKDLPVPPPASALWPAIGVGVLLAAAFVALAVGLGRRNRAKRDLVRAAVRSGRLPDIGDPLLRSILQEHADRLGTWRWSWLAIGAVQLLLAGSHFIGGPGADRSVYSRLYWGLDAAFWVGLGAVWTARAWRERPKVLRLLAELDARSAPRVGP